VRVQPTELMQVLTNLVTNSADAMDSKGIVRVSCDYPSFPTFPIREVSPVFRLLTTASG